MNGMAIMFHVKHYATHFTFQRKTERIFGQKQLQYQFHPLIRSKPEALTLNHRPQAQELGPELFSK